MGKIRPLTSRIYFLNHVESLGNAEQFIKGQYPCPLTPNGEEELQLCMQEIREASFDLVISSDLDPCYATARLIADALHIPHLIEKGLRIRYSGCWSHKPIALAQEVSDHLVRQHDRESDLEIQLRATTALKKIERTHPEKKILLLLNSSVAASLHFFEDSLGFV